MVDEESIQRLIRLHPLLRIARWHLDRIDTTETTPPELAALVVDHAVVATVFSAAAVERRLSDFLCSPILFMEEEGPNARTVAVLLAVGGRSSTLLDGRGWRTASRP